MRQFKNFLSEFKEPEISDNFGGDSGDNHAREFSERLGEVMTSMPLIHNTPEGTYKFKSLSHAVAAHGSQGFHAQVMGQAIGFPHIQGLAKDLHDGYIGFGQILHPHVIRAIEKAKTLVSPTNPVRSVDANNLAEDLYSGFVVGSGKHLTDVVESIPDEEIHPKLRGVNRIVLHMAMTHKMIREKLNKHPHQFIFDGAHMELIPEHIDPQAGKAAEFFPKWNR